MLDLIGISCQMILIRSAEKNELNCIDLASFCNKNSGPRAVEKTTIQNFFFFCCCIFFSENIVATH